MGIDRCQFFPECLLLLDTYYQGCAVYQCTLKTGISLLSDMNFFIYRYIAV